jgi:transcriptional regulator with XRE-family HTH domain
MTQSPVPEPAAPNSVSWRAVELVRRKISNVVITASDSDVARAIGVSRGAIWGYKSGRDSMSHDTLLRVQNIAQLSEAEFTDLLFDLLLEGNPPDANFLRKAKKAMHRAMKKYGNPASVLFVLCLLIGLGSPTRSEAYTVAAEGAAPSNTYYGKSRRKLRRWLKYLIGLPLSLGWTWARTRSTGSPLSSSSLSPVST